MIAKREVTKHMHKIVRSYYPDLLDSKLSIKWQSRESPYEYTIKHGLQRMVDEDGNITVVMIDDYRKDPVMLFGRLFHELGHAKQIKLGWLKFDGTTYIWRDQRFPLKFRMDGSYEPKYKTNLYYRFRFGRDFWAPWEEFDSMIRPLAEHYSRRCGYYVSKAHSAALDEIPDALVK